MQLPRTVCQSTIPISLLTHLETRDAALWVLDSFVTEAGLETAASLLRLPWRLVLTESSNPELLKALDEPESASDPLVRRRGFVQLIDTNPADVLLPPRCLPIYLLNGRSASSSGLAAMTRRLTMLDALRRLRVKELIIAAGTGGGVPLELAELWNDGFRSIVTVVSEAPTLPDDLESWRAVSAPGTAAAYIPFSAQKFSSELVASFLSGRAADRVGLRVRDLRGDIRILDVTGVDDPEHPVLSNYELIQDEDLRYLQPEDLTADDIEAFFRDPAGSWKPYAAGMPWARTEAWDKLRHWLGRLDRMGADADRIAYISSESGAGGTTLMRMLAWSAAQEGYPTLVAGPAPFSPRALEVVNFVTRVEALRASNEEERGERRYEVPWVIAFDVTHWEGRSDELRRFMREFEQSGRAACILTVSGPYVGLDYYDNRSFVSLANLTHTVRSSDAMSLGKHLNKFLKVHSRVRSDHEWQSFYNATAIQAERGVSAFWIALAFWVPRQFEMTETVQSWIYRQFKQAQLDQDVRRAILDVAGMSSERRPLPEGMLPPTSDWPVSEKLEDSRKAVAGLALVRINRDGDKYWALAHDVIGRYLLTALFYDPLIRDGLGFAGAANPEHLRFLILRRLASMPALGLKENRTIAEEFAISIFKIDPDHGHATFVQFWREVLTALDEMPRAFRMTSRSFLHHSAISRRRIANMHEIFEMDVQERIDLLERAVHDIKYALDNIPYTPGGERDLSLYNSLALGYQDLADEESERGAAPEVVQRYRGLAREATQRLYSTDPDNRFVIETYAKHLIIDARLFPDRAAENIVEALAILYSAMERDPSRRFALSKIADGAMNLLLEQASSAPEHLNSISSETNALITALRALASGVVRFEGMGLSDYPPESRRRAAELLAGPVLQGNPQAVRLRYAIAALDAPYEFRSQLELLQSLQSGGIVFSPQMRLELACLLQQCGRHFEAARAFRELRKLWSEGENYGEVPSRLRWLMSLDQNKPQQVTAVVTSRQEHRRSAKVRELQNTEVFFRAQEFGVQDFRAGSVVRGFISFGHNGPFLRPVTALQS